MTIFDALDECDEGLARELVVKLTTLRAPLRIFATSRDNSQQFLSYFP